MKREHKANNCMEGRIFQTKLADSPNAKCVETLNYHDKLVLIHFQLEHDEIVCE